MSEDFNRGFDAGLRSANVKFGVEMEELLAEIKDLRVAAEKKIERLQAEIANLRTPDGYWDEEQDYAIAPDRIDSTFDLDAVFPLIPYHKLPEVWVWNSEDGPEFFDTEAEVRETLDG